jgi:NAD(P)-dependent dehydrogenase (short-subunit alcohol dehydrogenase family)
MRLGGKVAVVTGATRGVGRGVGRELAREGARVFVRAVQHPNTSSLTSGSREYGATIDSTSTSTSPEFIGRAVAALAADPDVLRRTGKVLVAANLAIEYGFTDVDGKTPRPLTLADV